MCNDSFAAIYLLLRMMDIVIKWLVIDGKEP